MRVRMERSDLEEILGPDVDSTFPVGTEGGGMNSVFAGCFQRERERISQFREAIHPHVVRLCVESSCSVSKTFGPGKKRPRQINSWSSVEHQLTKPKASQVRQISPVASVVFILGLH